MELLISCLTWLGYRFLVDSYNFTRYSIAQVASLYDPGSPIVLYPFGNRTIIFTTGDACKHILCDPKHRNNYRQRFGREKGLKELGMFHHGLIWNNDLRSWKESRGCFQYGLVDETFQDVEREAFSNVSHVLQNAPVDANSGAIHMMNALRWVTLNFTVKNLLGLTYIKDWGDAVEMIDAIVAYFKAWEFFLVRPWWVLVWSKEFQSHRDASKHLHDICERLVGRFEETIRANPEKKWWSTCLGHAYKKYQDKTMSRNELVQLTLEILLAGTDTSSVTMFYCLGYLAEHPCWYAKVQREVDLASSSSYLPILQACIKESMRLKPVGPIIMRRFHGDKKDIVDGQTIHPRDQVILHLAAMNRHNVDTQDTFDPSRFLNADNTPKKENFAFYPFGKGPKGCVGEYLAMVEMQATMFHLLRTRQIFFVPTADGQREYSMETMKTNWDIAQQPQKDEEMQMIVKPLTRRVFFVGPSSTGKTTMIQAMSERFPDAKVHSEIARKLLKQHGITDCKKELLHNPKRNAWFQNQIVGTYSTLHNSITVTAAPEDYHALELFDRCAIDAIVYSRRPKSSDSGDHSPGENDDDDDPFIESSKEWKDCLDVYLHPQRTLVILFGVVEAFRKNDNVRLLPPLLKDHVAEEVAFEAKMKQLGIPFQKLSEKDPDRRQEQLVEFIQDFVAE